MSVPFSARRMQFSFWWCAWNSSYSPRFATSADAPRAGKLYMRSEPSLCSSAMPAKKNF